MTYREHSEISKAHVRAILIDIGPLLDELVGWYGNSGYNYDRVIQARGLLRQEHDILVTGHEDSESGVVVKRWRESDAPVREMTLP